jgi:hypothetical protein
MNSGWTFFTYSSSISLRLFKIDSRSGAVGAASSPSPEEAPLESAAPSSSATAATNFHLLSLFPTFFCLALILPGPSTTPLKIPTTAAQPPKLGTLGIRRCRTSDDVDGCDREKEMEEEEGDDIDDDEDEGEE